jgi:hypothetical protein
VFGRRKSLLLVDLDNVMSLLTKEFAANIPAWVDWLAAGGFDPKKRKRHFIRKMVYWGGQNDLHRTVFEAEGFIATACPAEVQSKTTTSDVHLIMDAMHWACRQGRIQEMVLLSTDTDFAPLVRRLAGMKVDSFVLVNPANPSSVVYRDCAAGTFSPAQLRATYAEELLFQPAGIMAPPAGPKRPGAKAKVDPARLVEPKAFDLTEAAMRLANIAAAQPGAPIGRRAVSNALKSVQGFATTGRTPWLGCGSYIGMIEALAERDPRLAVRPDANGGVALFAATDQGRET